MMNETKAEVIRPLDEIYRLMDEVLFDPAYVAAQKLVDGNEEKVEAARQRIRELLLIVKGQASDEEGNLYDIDFSSPQTVLQSERGAIVLYGSQIYPATLLKKEKPSAEAASIG